MRNKGFTLVELLGVIILLAVIALIAFPPILNQIKKSQNQIDDATNALIISSAKLYVDNNHNLFSKKDGNVYCISIDELLNRGYLTEGMLGSNDELIEDFVVKVSYSGNYSYELVNVGECEVLITE